MKHTERMASLPLSEDDLQWSVEICEDYQGDKAVMIGRVHHGLSDGLGTIIMISSIDGNKNLPAIPQMKDLSGLKKAVLTLLSPVLFAYSLYLDLGSSVSSLFEKKVTESIDKAYNWNILFNYRLYNPYELTHGFSGKKSLSVSKIYNFDEIR